MSRLKIGVFGSLDTTVTVFSFLPYRLRVSNFTSISPVRPGAIRFSFGAAAVQPHAAVTLLISRASPPVFFTLNT